MKEVSGETYRFLYEHLLKTQEVLKEYAGHQGALLDVLRADMKSLLEILEYKNKRIIELTEELNALRKGGAGDE